MELLLTTFVYICVITITSLRSQTILNPVSIALCPLVLAALILVLDPLGYGYPTVHVTTAMMLMIYGLIMGLPYTASFPRRVPGRLRCANGKSRYSQTRLRIVASALLSVGIFGYTLKLVMVFGEHNTPLDVESGIYFIRNNIYIMEHSLRQGWSLLHYVGYLGLVYAAYMFAMDAKVLRFSNAIVGTLSLLYMASLAALFIKVQLVIGLLLFLFTYAVLDGRGWKKASFVTLLIGILSALIDNYMYSGSISVGIEFVLRYISGSIIGLDNYLNEININQSFGANTLQPIYFLLEKAGVDTGYHVFNRFYVISEVGTAVNTGTILLGPYLDYGVAGVVVFCLGLSVVSRWLMVRVKLRNDLTYVLCYSIILCVLFVGFIGGIYTHLEFLLIFVLHGFFELSGLMRKPRSRANVRLTAIPFCGPPGA